MKSEKICCICGKKIVGHSNNPYPYRFTSTGRCCDDCNNTYVIPTRLSLLFVSNEVEKKDGYS